MNVGAVCLLGKCCVHSLQEICGERAPLAQKKRKAIFALAILEQTAVQLERIPFASILNMQAWGQCDSHEGNKACRILRKLATTNLA